MNTFPTLLLFAFVLLAFSGCSSRVLYESLQEIERLNCNDIENMSERQECLDRVNETSYDQYQMERNEQSQKEEYDQYQKERFDQYQMEQEEAQQQ